MSVERKNQIQDFTSTKTNRFTPRMYCLTHGSGVGPVRRDSGIGVEHALVRAGHGQRGGALDGVSKPVLVHVGGSDGGGTEEGGRADTARVGAHAGGKLLEVVEGIEHFCAETNKESVRSMLMLLHLTPACSSPVPGASLPLDQPRRAGPDTTCTLSSVTDKLPLFGAAPHSRCALPVSTTDSYYLHAAIPTLSWNVSSDTTPIRHSIGGNRMS